MSCICGTSRLSGAVADPTSLLPGMGSAASEQIRHLLCVRCCTCACRCPLSHARAAASTLVAHGAQLSELQTEVGNLTSSLQHLQQGLVTVAGSASEATAAAQGATTAAGDAGATAEAAKAASEQAAAAASDAGLAAAATAADVARLEAALANVTAVAAEAAAAAASAASSAAAAAAAEGAAASSASCDCDKEAVQKLIDATLTRWVRGALGVAWQL
jgi:hypothetical protein